MKPFTIYHSMDHALSSDEQQLVSLIREVVEPDMIFLLGSSLYRRCTESIFNTEAPSSQYFSDYQFLIIIDDLGDKPMYEWQERVEQHCGTFFPVTTIILQADTFNDWIVSGHRFARSVCQSSVCLYNARNLTLPNPGLVDSEAEKKAVDKIYRDGLTKTREFLAGADLFEIRTQYKMAAFMLHQAAEHALHTLLQVGTGFHSCTHNLDRLIRYGCLVSYKLPDVFPRKTDSEKRLFCLLQKAYIEARYRDSYIISLSDLKQLSERVNDVKEILEEYLK